MRGRLFSSTTGDLSAFFETAGAESDVLEWESGAPIDGAGTGAETGIAATGVGEILVVELGGGGKSSSFGTFLTLLDFPCASLTCIQIFQHSSAIYKNNCHSSMSRSKIE